MTRSLSLEREPKTNSVQEDIQFSRELEKRTEVLNKSITAMVKSLKFRIK